jgi:hypothetical protein
MTFIMGNFKPLTDSDKKYIYEASKFLLCGSPPENNEINESLWYENHRYLLIMQKKPVHIVIRGIRDGLQISENITRYVYQLLYSDGIYTLTSTAFNNHYKYSINEKDDVIELILESINGGDLNEISMSQM